MNTDEKIIKFLQEKRNLINLSGIAKESGINRAVLGNAMKGNKDGNGYTITIPEKHWSELIKTLKKIGLK
jgi:hypothetical protein